MPVVVDTNKCPCSTPCFPAKMCPHDVLHFNFEKPTEPATLNPELCGDCKGICTNFCDPHALRFASSMEEWRIAEAELTGSMTQEEIQAERNRLKEVAEEKKQQKSAAVIDVTSATFEQEVLKATLPVVLDCWAPWCGPCKAFAPTFTKLSQEYAGRLKFCKVNTDSEPSIAQALGIQSIPTLVFFYQGQVLGGIPGAMNAEQFRSAIEQVLQSVGAAITQAGDGSQNPPTQLETSERVLRGKPR